MGETFCYYINVIDLGTYPLHIAINAFGKLVQVFKEVVDIDVMAIDFHFFFKCSAGRWEDFQKIIEITGVIAQLEKHCTSKWTSLDKVLVKLNHCTKNVVFHLGFLQSHFGHIY